MGLREKSCTTYIIFRSSVLSKAVDYVLFFLSSYKMKGKKREKSRKGAKYIARNRTRALSDYSRFSKSIYNLLRSP